VWWREVLIVAAFYMVYAQVRDWHGEHTSSVQYHAALLHAQQLVRIERFLHIHVEMGLQVALTHARWLVRSANVFYGSAHFVVTVVVLLWLFRSHPERYRRWRTALGVGTALGLVGFALFPTLPPRLLPSGYGFTDTLHSVGGLWSFNSGVVERISDPFAAMPSLHLCWSTWCALAVYPHVRHRVGRTLVVAYPLVTAVVVLITGNHWLLDLVGGLACCAVGVGVVALAGVVGRRTRTRHPADIELGGRGSEHESIGPHFLNSERPIDSYSSVGLDEDALSGAVLGSMDDVALEGLGDIGHAARLAGVIADPRPLADVGDPVLEQHEHLRAMVDAQAVTGAQVLIDPDPETRHGSSLSAGGITPVRVRSAQ
jgi:hypothetical protein